MKQESLLTAPQTNADQAEPTKLVTFGTPEALGNQRDIQSEETQRETQVSQVKEEVKEVKEEEQDWKVALESSLNKFEANLNQNLKVAREGL